MEVKKQPLDAAVTLNDVVALFLPKSREKSIHLSADPVPPKTPPLGRPGQTPSTYQPDGQRAQIHADGGNGHPSGGSGGPCVRSSRESLAWVAPERSLASAYVRLSVADTGPGIRPEDQQRIFNRFEQVREIRNTVRGAKGTGLGLAIARGLATAHGGVLTLKSAPGQGSVFSVVLPGEV